MIRAAHSNNSTTPVSATVLFLVASTFGRMTTVQMSVVPALAVVGDRKNLPSLPPLQYAHPVSPSLQT